MKRLLIAVIAIVSMTSCSKKRCYQCTVTTYSNGATGRATSTVCDMTEDDKRKYEQAGTTTSYGSYSGYTTTMSTVTTCN